MGIENPKTSDKQRAIMKRFACVDGDNMVGAYFCDSSHSLLSIEKETELSNRLTEGRSFSGKRDLDHLVLTEGAKDAFDTLVTMNLRLVNDYASKYSGNGIELLDLIQAGNIGLMKATSKFDLEFGYRFSTYATWWIKQAIAREIANNSRTIRIPVHQLDTLRIINQTIIYLTQKNGETPKASEVAEYLDMNPKKVELLIQRSSLPLSMDKRLDDEDSDGAEFGDYIKDNSVRVEIESGKNIFSEKLTEVFEAFKKQKPRSALILGLRYGLIDGNIYTLDEVGNRLGLSRERVRQIESESLNELSKYLEKYKNYVFDKQN